MTDSPPSSKRPLISLPFIVVVGVLAFGAYFGGPYVMQWVMYQQELARSKRVVVSGTASDEAPDESASMGGGGRGGRGGGFDPEAFFAERDADANGKLEGEEISERMREGLAETDTDGDGAVSKEELLARMQQFGGRGGAGGRGEGGGRGGRGAGGERQRPASDTDDESSSADNAGDASPSQPDATHSEDDESASDDDTPPVATGGGT